jgi:hypothetical protein
MEDEGEFDLEDEDEEELPKSLGESRNVTKMISKTIAESVFNKLVARGILEAKGEGAYDRAVRGDRRKELQDIKRAEKNPLKKKFRSLTSDASFTDEEDQRYFELLNDPKFKEYLKLKRKRSVDAPDQTEESKYSGMKKKVKKPEEKESQKDSITDKQIKQLRDGASQAGDTKQVKLCDAALNGNSKARAECAKAISNAKAMD